MQFTLTNNEVTHPLDSSWSLISYVVLCISSYSSLIKNGLILLKRYVRVIELLFTI